MKSHYTAETAAMNTARNIEFQITRQLVKRREAHRNSQSVDRIIKVLALSAGALILAVCVPELLLPIFFVSALVTLGF